MNFINSFLSGPQMMMLNLNQRSANSNPTSLFNPSSQSAKVLDLKQYNENSSNMESHQNQKTCNKQQQFNTNNASTDVNSSKADFQQSLKENTPQLPLMNTILEDQTAKSMLLTSLIISHQQNLISQLLATPSNPLLIQLLQQHQQAVAQSQINSQKNLNQTENCIKNQMRENLKLSENERNTENEEEYDEENDEQKDSINLRRKRIQKINICGHQDKEHYAKGMCSNCYHQFGRTQKPWLCGHDKLYARGLCQNCYINQYNQVRQQNGDQQSVMIGQQQRGNQNNQLKLELDQAEDN